MRTFILLATLWIMLLAGGTAVMTVPYHTNNDWFVKTLAKASRVSVKYSRSYGAKPTVFARIWVG